MKWYLVCVRNVDNEFERILHCERKDLPEWSYLHEADSLEELHELIAGFKCSKCGGVVTLSYTNNDDLINHKMCFKCDHFRLVKLTANNDKNRMIINHSSYHVVPDNNGFSKGFGGREFKIKRFDNPNVIVTHNLWHQGEIPKIWRDEIPDNAVFI